MTDVVTPDVLDPALAERLAKMSPAKRALFLKAAGLPPELAQQILVSGDGSGIPERDPNAPVPMSFAQELLWRLERASPGYAYNVPRSTRLQGPLDVDALHKALDALAARHEILRTTFDLVEGRPRQIVHPAGPVGLDIVDLGHVPAARREDEAKRIVRERSQRPFDLGADSQLRTTLIRVGPNDHVLLVESHHVASDVISRGITFRELVALYREARGGAPAQLPALRRQYADFAAWQRHDLQGPRLEKLLSYWRDRLAGSRPLELPADKRGGMSPEGGMESLDASPALRDGLRRLNAAHGTTLFMAMLAAIDVLLSRYTQQDDVVVGSPISGRPHGDVDGVVGYFVNTLVLRTSLDGNPTFAELLERVRTTCLGAFEHQDVPYELLLTELSEAGRSGHAPLFNVMVSALDADTPALALDGTTVSAFGSSRGAAKFDLQFAFREHDGGIKLGIEYRRDLFEAETVSRMLRHLETLLTAAVAAPETPVADLTLLSESERNAVLRDWNATSVDYPDETLVGLFAAQAARTPNVVAVEDEQRALTYAELESAATALARTLAANGVRRGSLVGICAERSVELVVGLLAIVKAGGAYVPLDPEYPADRLSFMVSDSAVPALLTTKALAERIPALAGSTAQMLMLDDVASLRDEGGGAIADVAPGDAAYMIYTSGSTGKPKGALNAHRGIVNRLLWMQSEYKLGPTDVVLQKTPFSFDVSVWEFFWPLITGAKLVMARPGGHRDTAYLVDVITARGVSVCHFVPSMLRVFLADASAGRCVSLRDVMASGEALTPDLVASFYGTLRGARLHNLYGPTECAVDVTYWACPPSTVAPATVPIGRPVANTQVYVLDAKRQPVPVGVPGELYLAGVQVGVGYHGRPELTAERFVADPYSETPNARMYRTGDKARWRGDGTVEYLGRLDFQVKIRGFRIELGEIESVLAAHSGLHHAAVVAVDTRDGPQLAAYYVPSSSGGPEHATVTATALRAHLRESLPEYMVPAFFTALASMPLNASGKVDRASLPAPHAAASETKYVPPRTVHEHNLVHIWKELLETRPIGIRDDFFDLGGHSLLAVRMLAEIEQLSGRRIPLAALFEDATIEGLGSIIESAVFNEAEPPVVVMPSNPDARPFAFLHGDVRGGGWYSRQLAQLLGPTVKLVVLPTIRPNEPSSPRTIETMAAHQLRELRKVQPTGPYRLGGFCLGGTIAFEMAQQLRDAGETVEHLILIGSGLANPPYRGFKWLIDALLPAGTDLALLKRRALWLGRVKRVRRMSMRERSHVVGRVVTRVLSRITRRSSVTGGARRPAQRRGIFARPATDVIDLWKHVAASYIPRPYPTQIDLVVGVERAEAADFDIVASMDTEVSAQPAIGQRGFGNVSSRVRIHPVQASFMEVITTHIETLAEHFRACLGVDAPRATDRRE